MGKKKVRTIGAPVKRTLVEKSDEISLRKQCEILQMPISTLYYRPKEPSHFDYKVMSRLDEIYLEMPYYGSRNLTKQLQRDGFPVNRKRIHRLMRLMGIEAIYQKPKTSRKHPNHPVYPYLLKSLKIDRPMQVWCADITYIRLKKGWVYLVAIMDWYSRKVLSWKVSVTMDAEFCVTALEEAIDKFGRPEIFNTDQGSQFTSLEFTGVLKENEIQISMDGRGRFLDNIFIERLWRSLKYECVYLNEYLTVSEAKESIRNYIRQYNEIRLHSSHDYRTPEEVFEVRAA